ncbi:MAG: SPOR domain-containing protein, partial [Pseudomonadota bacterium]
RAGEPLISLVLFADERIDLLLSTPQLQIMSPQSIQTIALPSLNRKDTTTYMHYLLQVEGLPADLELKDARLTKLFRETKGNPGLLRQVILNAIGEADKRSGRWITASYLPMIIGASLLLLIFGLLFFQDEINRLFQSPEPTTVEATAAPMQLQQLEVEIDSIQADAVQVLNQNEESTQEEEPTAIAEPVGLEESAAVSFEQPLLLTDSSSNWVDEVVQEDDIKVQGTEFQASEIVQAPSEVTPDMVEAKPEILTARDSVVLDASMVDEAVVVEPKIQTQIDLLRREDWVLTRPAMHYTLQLLGVEKLQSLKEFIERHHLRDKAYYIETKRDGKPWYPLLWGEYPDKLSAIEGSHQLPLEVQSKGAWVRSFGALQDLLEK